MNTFFLVLRLGLQFIFRKTRYGGGLVKTLWELT